MRTTKLAFIAVGAAMNLLACTVKDVDTPSLQGPSSLARTIVMTADRDTLVQDGVQEAAIRLTAQVQPGQSENVRLRAQVFVDGVAQDFGTLSNKNPITPTTIFYRAPAAPASAAGQVPTTVTIQVTPDDSGDFRGEFSRQVDLRLLPPGVIQPINPNLAAAFTVTPAAPKILETVTFNASTTTNGGAACGQNCTYSWNFGDGTTSTGQIATHQYRAVGTYQVTLTVADFRGATATAIQAVTVGEATPPTGLDFTISPTEPEPGQTIFFNASAVRAAPGRTLVEFFWDFGDGTTANGVTVSKVYTRAGAYTVTLKVTDDARAFETFAKEVTVEVPEPEGGF